MTLGTRLSYCKMTDRRPGPPLFELLNQDQPNPDDGQGSSHDSGELSAPNPVQSQPSSATPDRPAPITAGVSRAERSAATMPEEPAPQDGGFHLSTHRAYLLIALVAVLLVFVWAIGYKAGETSGKAEMESMIPNKPSMILPPISNNQPTDDSPSTNTDPLPDDAVTQPPRVPAQASQAVMTAQGYKEVDPRVSGNNYLQLATFSAEQAADAILFMNDHSMPIIGVPVVDSGVRAGNNPSRYTLYSLGLAVPGGSDFSAMQAQRDEHKRAIAALGAQWQRERRGGSDFGESKTQWVKYN